MWRQLKQEIRVTDVYGDCPVKSMQLIGSIRAEYGEW